MIQYVWYCKGWNGVHSGAKLYYVLLSYGDNVKIYMQMMDLESY